jgi:hypothetical protein
LGGGGKLGGFENVDLRNHVTPLKRRRAAALHMTTTRSERHSC